MRLELPRQQRAVEPVRFCGGEPESLPSRLQRFETRIVDDEESDAQREHLRVYAIHAERYGLSRSCVEFGNNSVLIGDNASGKSTLYDVLGFVSDAL